MPLGNPHRLFRATAPKTTTAFLAAVVVAASLIASPTRAVAASPYIKGIDVSHYQGSIDWTRVAGAGYRFAFAKASEGTTFTDPNYAAYRAGAKKNHIHFGAYHFARPAGATLAARRAAARAQADHFLAVARPAPGDLLPVLDLESSGGLDPKALSQWVEAWLTRIQHRLGVKAIIYSGISFWTTAMADTTRFADEGYKVLWLPHYTSDSSTYVPANNWGGHGWTFWQWTSVGSIPGIAGHVDLDRYAYTHFARVEIPSVVRAPVASSPPVVTGRTTVGSVLTGSTGTWSHYPTSFRYSWLRCDSVGAQCVGIQGATGSRYTLKRADYQHTIELVVTASNSAGSASATSAHTTVVGDDTAPASPAVDAGAGMFTRHLHLGVAWGTRDDASGIASYDVTYRAASARHRFTSRHSLVTATRSKNVVFTGKPGHTYCFYVTATDKAGNVSPAGRDCTTIPADDRRLTISGDVTQRSGLNGFFMNTASQTDSRGQYLAKGDVSMRRMKLVALHCPNCGVVDVFFSGHLLKTVPLATGNGSRAIEATPLGTWSSLHAGNVKIVVRSQGHPVRVDGLAMARI